MLVLEPKQLVQEPLRAEMDDTVAAKISLAYTVVQLSEISPWLPLVPGEMWLGSLRDPRLRIVSPIRVRFFSEHDRIVAEAIDLDEFGFGSNMSEAVCDIQRAVSQLYFSLEESKDRLGADLASTSSALQRLVVKTKRPA